MGSGMGKGRKSGCRLCSDCEKEVDMRMRDRLACIQLDEVIVCIQEGEQPCEGVFIFAKNARKIVLRVNQSQARENATFSQVASR